jgi:hypothetical protein
VAESKSTCSALYFKDHSEKLAKFHLFSINGLGTDSECAVGPMRLTTRRPLTLGRVGTQVYVQRVAGLIRGLWD